jgi:DNA-binding NtrC family response regulator
LASLDGNMLLFGRPRAAVSFASDWGVLPMLGETPRKGDMEAIQTVLIVDSDAAWAARAREFLTGLGYAAVAAGDAAEGLALFRERRPEAAICEHSPPIIDGLALCRRLLEMSPGAAALISSTDASTLLADLAADAGAVDFLAKPVHPLQIHLSLQQAWRRRRLEESNDRLRRLLERRNYLEDLIGGSPPMRSLYELIDDVAAGDIPALIVGGPGSEKLAAARSLHKRSPRARQNLVEIRADAESAETIQELLGAGPDGPSDMSAGLLERADGGSLLVAEIDRLNEAAQVRLLDILEERQVLRPGAARPRRVDFRLLATSGQDLFQLTEEGRFRRDLYYRVNVAQIMIPSLRERLEDIPVLAHHFLRLANKRLGTRVEDFSLEALLTLVNYRWPGNVEELEKVVFDACRSSGRGVVTHQHLPIELYQAAAELMESDSAANVSFKQAKNRFEVRYFTDLLRKTGGNMTQAADLSRVGRPYLYKKLQEHKLKPTEFRSPESRRRRAASAELRLLKELSTARDGRPKKLDETEDDEIDEDEMDENEDEME